MIKRAISKRSRSNLANSDNSFTVDACSLLDPGNQSQKGNGNKHTTLPRDMNLQQEQLNRLVETQERLVQTQDETARALSQLNLAIRDLHSAIQNSDYKQPQSRLPPQSGNGGNRYHRASEISDLDASSENGGEDSVADDDLAFDRKQVRLDGLEVYAVVSALTAGTLVEVFDSYNPGDIADLFTGGRYLEVLMSIVFMTTGTIGIVFGLHCIFVFSLVTMYGRTALGMERDDALEVFFANTGLQRIHGFRTFVGSLYALMVQLIIVITAKVSSNPWVLLAVLIVTGRLMYYVHTDTQIVMEKAMVIFTAPSPPHRKSLTSAVSAIKITKNDDNSVRDESFSEHTNTKSINNKDSGDHSRASTSSSNIEKRTKIAADRRSQMVKKWSGGSTMNMPATAFNELPHRKTLSWTLDDDESASQHGEEATGDGGGRSRSSSVANTSKLTSRKKRSSLSQPAVLEMLRNLEDDDGEGDRNSLPVRKTRSSLCQPAAIEMMEIIEDENDGNEESSIESVNSGCD
ncbi:hypothetical protein ACHAWO_009867 [Cyclotella atomus]|uniref:Uncharacterized protein n=1 Tax=Cyclotella atomus TaxID=382360 RepID=A0ABD3P7B7_9STRA